MRVSSFIQENESLILAYPMDGIRYILAKSIDAENDLRRRIGVRERWKCGELGIALDELVFDRFPQLGQTEYSGT